MLYTYEYDGLGQLVEECSRPEQKCTAYAYDLNGNITTKTEYPVDITIKEYIFKNVNPSRTYTYSYNNDLWKDELTSYTRVIHDSSGDRTYTTPANTYDAIGNPTKYFGSDLEWDYGRQLRRFYSGIYDTTYSYNADGMLIKQAVTYNTIPDYPINYSYENFYDGTMLIRRTGQGFDAWFDYDESGSPVGMNVTTTTGPSSNPTVTTAQYYFIKNLQGDIVAMADATGTIKCRYTYDSWGKVLSTVGPNGTPSLTDHTNPANINPFRYRGYYYDAENQLYWLQSRFYDPSTGRFLNADALVMSEALRGANQFLYCYNNPILLSDYTGTRPVIGDSIRNETPEQRHMSFECINSPNSPYVVNSVIKYDVPLYKQKDNPICWAVCQVMLEDYRSGTATTYAEAIDRAKEIAKLEHSGKDWKSGGFPKHVGGFLEQERYSIVGLHSLLKNGPIYAHYAQEGTDDAHLVLVTGVDLRTGTVYTNNPWGDRGVQTYDEFLNGFAGMEKSKWTMKLNVYMIPA